MTGRRFVPAAVLSLMVGLSGCSATEDSAFDEALGWLGGVQDTERLVMLFVDVNGIRTTVGYNGDGSEEVDPWPNDPVSDWGRGATLLAIPRIFEPGDPPIFSTTSMSWTIGNYGQSESIIAVAHDTPEAAAAPEILRAEGWVEEEGLWGPAKRSWAQWGSWGIAVTDTDIHIVSLSGQVWAEPNAAHSARDDARIRALRPCLQDPHMAYIVSSTDDDVTFALAVTANSDGTGSAWSCIHAPGQVESLAAEVQPKTSYVTMGEQQVTGDVIRTELHVVAVPATIPAEAQLIARAPEVQFPGF